MINEWPNNKDLNEEDEEYEEDDDEIIQNEESPMDIDENFKNNVVNIKHELYENTVLSPELNTDEAQSINQFEKYLENINNVYILSINAQNGEIDKNKLNQFPKETRQLISNLLIWIADYFKKNQVADTIPYERYIQKSFKEYPFVQKNSFN
jgi:hypothetical protein